MQLSQNIHHSPVWLWHVAWWSSYIGKVDYGEWQMGKIVNLGLSVLWILIKRSWIYEQKKQNKQRKEEIIQKWSKCKIIFLTLRNDEGWSHYNWFDITKTQSGVKHWHWITCQGQLVQRSRMSEDFVKTRSNVWKIFTFIFIFITCIWWDLLRSTSIWSLDYTQLIISLETCLMLTSSPIIGSLISFSRIE